MQPSAKSLFSFATALVAAALLLVGDAAAQTSPCGGTLTFTGGAINLGNQLATAMPLTEDTRACLSAVGKQLTERPYVRSLTIVVRLPDDQRKSNKALDVANAMKQVLVDAGAPARRISTVAPSIGHGQVEGVQLAYSELRDGRPVAKLLALAGTASYGRDRNAMVNAAENTMLRTFDFFQVAARSRAVVHIADDSRLHVEPSTLLKFGKITLNSEYKRDVSFELLSGTVKTVASHNDGASFQLVTRAAVAGVRGTEFRAHITEGGFTRIEVLDGRVALGNAAGAVDVGAGYGTRVQENQAPEPARALLKPAIGHRPLTGTFAAPPELTWQAVAGARGYVLELATNAEFSKDVDKVRIDGATSARPDANLAQKKWFWRVSAIDKDGFIGMPSKIFTFQVDPSAQPATPAQPAAKGL